jgi:hypothetical protein
VWPLPLWIGRTRDGYSDEAAIVFFWPCLEPVQYSTEPLLPDGNSLEGGAVGGPLETADACVGAEIRRIHNSPGLGRQSAGSLKIWHHWGWTVGSGPGQQEALTLSSKVSGVVNSEATVYVIVEEYQSRLFEG